MQGQLGTRAESTVMRMGIPVRCDSPRVSMRGGLRVRQARIATLTVTQCPVVPMRSASVRVGFRGRLSTQ